MSPWDSCVDLIKVKWTARLLAPIVGIALLAHGTRAPGESDATLSLAPGACPTYENASVAGTVANSALNEMSGIVQSRSDPDLLWVHNDSGDSARIFAVTTAGAYLGSIELDGVSAYDWEDIAIGPGAQVGTDYIYVGDIGDNAERRSDITVYRLSEPGRPSGGEVRRVPVDTIEALRFAYPDGPHNAEALVVDPRTGEIAIFTKSATGITRVFRASAPHITGAIRTLDAVGTVSVATHGSASPYVTGADISAGGTRIVLRTYTHAIEWIRVPTTALGETITTTEPCTYLLASEPQGEAIGYRPDGHGFFTVSEHLAQPLYWYAAVPDIPLPRFETDEVNVVNDGLCATCDSASQIEPESGNESLPVPATEEPAHPEVKPTTSVLRLICLPP